MDVDLKHEAIPDSVDDAMVIGIMEFTKPEEVDMKE